MPLLRIKKGYIVPDIQVQHLNIVAVRLSALLPHLHFEWDDLNLEIGELIHP